MLPTIAYKGETVIISKWHKKGRRVQIGDMVSLVSPGKPWERAMKRVAGMPGDFVLRDSPLNMSGEMIQV
jgi:mitochondrial inner membrane protease subunit 1